MTDPAAPASAAPAFDQPYDPALVEPRWYAFWEEHGVFAASDAPADTRPVYVVPDAAAQRDGLAAHGPRAHAARSRTCSSAGTACAATTRSGSRASITPASPRRPSSSACSQREGKTPPRPRARGVRRARLGVEGARAAAASPLQQRVLGASADWTRAQVHDGPGHVRAPCTEAFVRLYERGAHLPRHAPHQLVPRVHDGAQRSRGRERRGRQRRALRVRLPGRRTAAARSSSPRRAPRRCSATPRSPCTRTIRATRTCTARRVKHPFVDRDDPDHHRRRSSSTRSSAPAP